MPNPLLRALSPLSCGTAARTMARLRQACSCPLAAPGGTWHLEASSGGRGGWGWALASPASPGAPAPLGPPVRTCLPVDQGGRRGWSDGLATPGQDQDARRAIQASLWGGGWVSMSAWQCAVCSWQAIRHARSMSASSPTAGEEWRGGGGSCPLPPPWSN